MFEMETKEIRIAAVLGSARPGSYTGKALSYVVKELEKNPNVSVDVIDPAKMDIPLPGTAPATDDVKEMTEIFQNCSGAIFSTPEYHGGFSSVVKLVIDNMGYPSGLAEKPVGLLGVASGQIGAIKSLEMLRGVCSHIGSIVLPGPISIANVNTVFDEDGNCTDESTKKRMEKFASNFLGYIEKHVCPDVALETLVRESQE